MKKEIFGFLAGKYLKQRIIDSLLLFLSHSLVICGLSAFLYNLLFMNRTLFVVFLAVAFVFDFYKVFLLFFREYESIKDINRINPKMRNLILAAYEEKLRGKEFDLQRELDKSNVNDFNCICLEKRVKIMRILALTIIQFLLLILLFPLHFSNAAGLTEKRAVVSIEENKIIVKGYNLGSITGDFFIEDLYGAQKFDESKKYPSVSLLFFKGPRVISNKIKFGLLSRMTVDSLITLVQPHPYQKRDGYTENSTIVYIPEYADVKSTAYAFENTRTFFTQERFENDTILKIQGTSDSLTLLLINDAAPAVKILVDSESIRNRDIVLLPCAYADDYEVKRVGVIIKTEADSITFFVDSPNESISFFEINLSNIAGNEGWIKAFASDNNPFRNQTSYSQELRFSKKLDVIELLEEIEANEVFSGFSEMTERMTDELSERRMEIEKKSIEETIDKYSENLKDVSEALKELEQSLQDASRKSLPEEIMKQMYEIKKEIDKIDEEVLSKIIEKVDKIEKSEMNREAAMEMMKRDSKMIEESLKQLQKMLETLNKLSELKNFQERIENMEKMMENENNKQKDVTDELGKEKERAEESENLKEWTEDLDEAESLSKAAEEDSKKKSSVKEKLEKIKKEAQEKMNSLSGNQKYDKDQVILTLLALNEMITEKKSALGVYASVLNFAHAENDPKNPLFLLIQRGRMIVEEANSSVDDIINYNFFIISHLLKKMPPSGGGMSMEQMMDALSSLSEEQKSLSETLWNMFDSQNMGSEMMNEISRYQKEIARKLKELGEKSGDGGGMSQLGDSLADVAEKIEKNEINEDILKKQDRILNKMLKMTKALYKEGITEKRESKTGKEYAEPVRLAVPEDYGFKKSSFEKMLKKFLTEYRDESIEFIIKKYYMELLR
ncbi:MAG: hypothetical protein AB7T10_00575 [bacterium]